MKSIFKKIISGSFNTTLVLMVAALFGTYSFFIAHSVIAVNQRKDLMNQVQTVQTAVSNSEIQYFDLASAIGTDTVTKLGFVNSETPDFAYTNPSGQDTVALR